MTAVKNGVHEMFWGWSAKQKLGESSPGVLDNEPDRYCF